MWPGGKEVKIESSLGKPKSRTVKPSYNLLRYKFKNEVLIGISVSVAITQ